MAAVRATRARHHEIVGLGRDRYAASQLCAMGLPFPFQHDRQAMDHHVEETADDQAEDARRGYECERSGLEERHEVHGLDPGVQNSRGAGGAPAYLYMII